MLDPAVDAYSISGFACSFTSQFKSSPAQSESEGRQERDGEFSDPCMPREFAWGGRANGILLPCSILPRRGPEGLRRDFETATLRAERAERAEGAEGAERSTDTYASPGGISRDAAGAGGEVFAGWAWAAQAVPPAMRTTTATTFSAPTESVEFVVLIEPSYGKFELGLRGLGGSGIARFCGAHSLGVSYMRGEMTRLQRGSWE